MEESKQESKFAGHADVLVGLQYGDEGKAKIIDILAEDDSYVAIARFQGGSNAGHTLVRETGAGTTAGKITIALNQIPSGIFYPNKILYLGSGCVVDPILLTEEIKKVEAIGISLEGRLRISDYASVVMPYHKQLDGLTGGDIGTTKRGIGPVHIDKAGRTHNYRICDILGYGKSLLERMDATKEYYNALFAALGTLEFVDEKKVGETISALMSLKNYVEPNHLFLVDLLNSGKNILFEGAQSVLLAVDKGCIPFVTSSYAVPGFAAVGGDVPLKYFKDGKVIGVAKAIMSRVGNGPFVTEFGGERSEKYCAENGGMAHTADVEKLMYPYPKELLKSKDLFKMGIGLRMLTGEYGAATKRPRRIGMFDMLLLKETCSLHGVDELYINKWDCLRLMDEIPIVLHYKMGKVELDSVPSSNEELRKAEIDPLWYHKDTPAEWLVDMFNKVLGTTIKGIGLGPGRDDMKFFE